MPESIGKHVEVEELPKPPRRKTRRWRVQNRHSHVPVAMIAYHTPWRRYVLHLDERDAIFSDDCLDDISGFIKRANTEQRGR